MKKFAVVVCADAKMLPAACCVLLNAHKVTSISIDFNLVGVGLDDVSKNGVIEFAKSKNIPLQLLDYSQQNFKNHELQRFGLATLTRLFLDCLLPQHYEKVLYLDTDVYIHDDLAELFSVDIEGQPLGAMVDVSKHGPEHIRKRSRMLGMSEGANMIAASMLLFDWQKTLSGRYLERSRMALQNGKSFKFLDQDALSIGFDGSFHPIDPSWNADPFMWKMLPRLRLVHFSGKVKPWHDNSPSMFEPYRSWFKETLRGSAWPHFVNDRSFTTKVLNLKDDLKFKLKVRKKTRNFNHFYKQPKFEK